VYIITCRPPLSTNILGYLIDVNILGIGDVLYSGRGDIKVFEDVA